MTARTAVLAAAFVSGLVAAVPSAEAADAGAPPALPACISVQSESRYIPFGYNHIVILTSGCSQDATCIVSTDVNPQPATVEVKAGTTVQHLTFQASPSQTFTAKVTCKLH